ncbi:MAG: tRNA (adenosine(37)-N6)-threonylcarbamoyltransferase complex ATPase subunit type 1 TsaE [Eubacteriales bacterium]|nr:tRNA (adenosine(37)-N6)-threonylcarbamoyltransferase complex ATPase subunit type 1 TsaE [Eubacteriales bacterium]MDD4324200.1 tRNA (adenosine(37)-N6)-threonylcarbamoyltransferase complex ATPase subunit type 1 TsaE [Eubacteriales bacterium]MDD4541270.1 tRNA (adenosine(37)-N6)-threonylcarbamoyltransferase complex ATPase subunit type 1 TsaE [Eubacteriales bacterium]
MPERYYTQSSEETENLGISLAKQLRAGDILLLYGDLAAGKTTLTRGIAKGLGVIDDVSSPTFTILQQYAARPGGLPMNHFDAYRLRNEDDWYAEGFDELLYTDAVSVIEWPENVLAALPEHAIEIHLTFSEEGSKRQIDLKFPADREALNCESEPDL